MRKNIIIFLLCVFYFSGYGQKISKYRIGLSYGFGEMDRFPYQNGEANYSYEIHFYKIQLNYYLINYRKFCLDLSFEPSYFQSKLQSINPNIVQIKNPDNMKLLETSSELKEMNEYSLAIGLRLSYPIFKKLSLHANGSIGPMYIDTETERMAKGFTFSDIFTLGIAYKFKVMTFETRYGIRHVSNAGFQIPNRGYNSTILEFGIMVDL